MAVISRSTQWETDAARTRQQRQQQQISLRADHPISVRTSQLAIRSDQPNRCAGYSSRHTVQVNLPVIILVIIMAVDRAPVSTLFGMSV